MAIPLQNTHAQYMVQLRPHNLILGYKLDTLMTCLVPFSLLLLFLILSSGFIPFSLSRLYSYPLLPFPTVSLLFIHSWSCSWSWSWSSQ
ncbi:hypothetical protein BKA57DRAFT_474461 [Linnemannia elongata]|nr:hypothetical protein BKA57DRAFT_474461 [Linnemannia elongata]